MGILNGEKRKTTEILRWTRRKQRRHIRTNEIYDFLTDRPSNHLIETVHTTTQPPIVDDLQTFRQALVMEDNTNRLDVSSYDHSEQLESFVRQQLANQLARKRDYHSTDSLTNDFPKSKRSRYT